VTGVRFATGGLKERLWSVKTTKYQMSLGRGEEKGAQKGFLGLSILLHSFWASRVWQCPSPMSLVLLIWGD
jgi:hypothetical protein